ncbi:hypothetical protein A3F65_02235 [Candidatus Saccharibacteria bacterium RIFCSPHIGHO2_12_FULL_47_16b]|nr:MAG: hypothetical protein A3F65_02235 [Candidatus Saccharibacteria bacterium RIFCSPHIGHO2_12_FULL_47_16b]OGL38939.1 MAG: hypothetical protein A3J32_00250 [Candidatus Saccharibacteria bacterium RIFCSPLOWO2_02_FULL_46_7]
MKTPAGEPFSQELNKWLGGDGPKTIASLIEVFGNRSFAIIILLLMIIPALPIPTGGIVHAFELVVMLLALEMIAGFKKIWLPASWQNRKLGHFLEKRAIPIVIKYIRWFEKRSSPRLRKILDWRPTTRIAGLFILVFTLGAFLSPPFTGLDTLPSVGVVLICLAFILGDAMLLVLGILIGSLGLAIVIGLSTLIVNLVHKLFKIDSETSIMIIKKYIFGGE